MSQSNTIPQASDMKAIRDMTELGVEATDAGTIQTLKTRRKLIADYYYKKEIPAEERQKFFDELSLLHGFFGFKKVWPAIKSNTPTKQTRSTEEKKQDIKDMHEFCWNLALEKAKKIYSATGKDQTILAEHFNKQYTHNWCS